MSKAKRKVGHQEDKMISVLAWEEFLMEKSFKLGLKDS